MSYLNKIINTYDPARYQFDPYAQVYRDLETGEETPASVLASFQQEIQQYLEVTTNEYTR